ncbi:phage antirepressor protein [archaeon]|nr:phage antirepressor protein [archaeon]
MDKDNALVVFEDKNIRRIWHNDEWWFVIKDVVVVLTESVNPVDYLKKLRKRDKFLSDVFKGGGQIDPPLGFEFNTAGGRQMLLCWNIIGMLRLIQSIPSKKAEPFKRWLAKVGYERVQEIENPELAQKRMKEIYEQKGYSKGWIEKRVRGIAIRDELTGEWADRGIETNREFSILTAEISKATFGMTPKEYKEFKELKHQNLRDHMTDLELIFNMLGEASTTQIARTADAQGFDKNRTVARKGGTIAGNARKELELESKEKISTPDNYLNTPEKIKGLGKNKKGKD